MPQECLFVVLNEFLETRHGSRDNAFHQINLYPVDSALNGFSNSYLMDSHLSSG